MAHIINENKQGTLYSPYFVLRCLSDVPQVPGRAVLLDLCGTENPYEVREFLIASSDWTAHERDEPHKLKCMLATYVDGSTYQRILYKIR